VDEEYPEGEGLEFKEQLPSKDGIDPWASGERRITGRARDAILDEVIALANASGGHVILGIEESDDHPKRAKGIRPLPDCAALADRLRHQVRDCIEPPLASFAPACPSAVKA
jgi:predicted HTH transcriptional regulator